MIVETTEYKCLQSQFSVLYNESMQIKTMLDETRNQLQTSKNQHLRQIEMMESEELIAQKRVRCDMIQMEDVLSQIRKEYEMLRIEFEQNLAANEQTAPINREMRHLITSLQNHNVQLKGEVHRYKRKYKDASAEIVKLRKDVDDAAATAASTAAATSAAAAAAAALGGPSACGASTGGDGTGAVGSAGAGGAAAGKTAGMVGADGKKTESGATVKLEGSAGLKEEDDGSGSANDESSTMKSMLVA